MEFVRFSFYSVGKRKYLGCIKLHGKCLKNKVRFKLILELVNAVLNLGLALDMVISILMAQTVFRPKTNNF